MMASISDTARRRRDALQQNSPDIYAAGAPSISRMAPAPAPRSRDAIGAADLKQILNRQQAEQLPEGDVRRRRF
jgi:hypothetical protein